MNNHEHLKNLVNLGFLVDEKVKNEIESLNEEEFYKLIESLKNENIFIVNDEVLKKLLSEDIKIIRTFTKLEKFNVQDYVRNLNERYSFLQNILAKKLELQHIVSINKASDGNASIIGLVKEKEEKLETFIISLEDSTGEIKAVIPKKLGERMDFDDVIALSGIIKDNVLNVDKILFPDVPLKPVNYSKDSIKIAFMPERKVDVDYIFFKNRIEDRIKNKEIGITNPCILKVNNVFLLIVLGFDPLDALKKRYIRVDSADFLIEPSPDIVFTDKDINTNYKGVSIVSKNKIIDLKTRGSDSI